MGFGRYVLIVLSAKGWLPCLAGFVRFCHARTSSSTFSSGIRETLVAGAEALQKLLEGGEDIERHCREIVDLEHQADDITREVLLAVRRSFITPFDRGDIKDLIQSMDDAIDMMHKTVKTIRCSSRRVSIRACGKWAR